MKKKHILYIQHADAMGGSVVSLKELILDALANGYLCTVLCSNETIANIYRQMGVSSVVSTIACFNHNTAFSYKLSIKDFLRVIKVLLRTMVSFFKLTSIVKEVSPDIVHLNSSNLVLYTLYFKITGVPTVFHVREYVVKGYFGFRKSLIRFLANHATAYIVYISEFEFEILNTRPEKSFVVYNYVHESEFRKVSQSSALLHNTQKFKIITVGGLFKLKGGQTILESLTNSDDDMELMVLGCEDPRINRNEIARVDGEDYVNDLIGLLNISNISSKVRFIGKVNNPADYISKSDVVLFWAASPHFPRPVFEAWLLKKPVLYYNPLFKNGKINASNVFVVPNNSAQALHDSIEKIKNSIFLSSASLDNTYRLAIDNFTERNFEKIDNLYKMCLNK